MNTNITQKKDRKLNQEMIDSIVIINKDIYKKR